MSRRGWLLFAAMSVIWGVPYLLIRVAVRQLDPTVLVWARTGIGAALLLPLAVTGGGLSPAWRRWRPLLVFAVVEAGASWWLLSDAERRVPSSLAGLLVAVVPLIGAVVTRLAGSEDRITRSRLAGLLVGLAGVASLVGLDVHGGQFRGIAEVLATATGYAIGPVIVDRWLRGVPAVAVNASALGLTAVAYTPLAVFRLPDRVPPARVLAAVAVLAVVCTAIAFVLFFALIREVGPNRATVITYLNPAVAVVLGVLVLSEQFTVGMAVGFPLVLLGSFLATRRPRSAAVAGAPPLAGTAGLPARSTVEPAGPVTASPDRAPR